MRMAMLSPTRQARVCPCSPDSDVQLKWHEMPLKQLIHGAWLGFQDIYAFDLAPLLLDFGPKFS